VTRPRGLSPTQPEERPVSPAQNHDDSRTNDRSPSAHLISCGIPFAPVGDAHRDVTYPALWDGGAIVVRPRSHSCDLRVDTICHLGL
jgi:hypothetical protein